MRPSILTHLAATKQSDQLNCTKRTPTSPLKSLELLRKSLQTVISRDIDAIIQNYLNVNRNGVAIEPEGCYNFF